MDTSYEKILDPMMRKYTIFPIHYPKIWSRYKQQLACLWTAEEIDFTYDYDDYLTLKPEVQFYIKNILAFFVASDGIVNKGIGDVILKNIQITEAIVMYQFQTAMENIHGEVYSLMLDNIIKDKDEKDLLFRSIENNPAIKKMADWSFDKMNTNTSFGEFLICNACIEGIFFSGAFASIFWIKKYYTSTNRVKPFMNGLTTSNKFISRDEGLHYESSVDVYEELNNKVSNDRIREIVCSAVEIAINFMTESLPVKLIGMNSDLMADYIRYIGDRTLVMFGCNKYYNVSNPFNFMETIGQTDKTNFFELRPHEYQNAYTNNNNKSNKIQVTDDF